MKATYIINRVLCSICVIAALTSCVKDPEFETISHSSSPETKIINSSEGAVAGNIVVYVDDATAEEWLSLSDPTRATTEGLSIVVDELRIKSIKPVFNLAKNGDIKRERGMHRWFTIEFDDEYDVEQAATKLASMPNIERVEYATSTPQPEVEIIPAKELCATRTGDYPFNDPMLSEQWALNNRGDGSIFSTAVAGEDVNAFEAWKYSTGNPNVVVAVIDEAVKYTHPDLAANMWTNTAELNGVEGVDDDGNGNYVGDVGHGTHVAGIIAATNNNGIGISSIAGGSGNGDGVRIMSVQIFRESFSAYQNEIALGFEYAADMGAAIAQCSWGAILPMTVYSYIESSVIYEGICYFLEHGGSDVMDGGVVIFAAGNEHSNYASDPAAHYSCVAVTATAPDGLPTGYTNYAYGCNIAAPGGDFELVDGKLNMRGAILSTVPSETPDPYNNGRVCYDSDYGYMRGTSMACPYVSGVAALALSYAVEHGRHLSNSQLVDIIHSSARDIDSRLTGTKDYYKGDGVVEQLDLSAYHGKMGIGSIDALCAMGRVSDMQTVAVNVNSSAYLKLNDHIGNGKMKIEFYGYEIDDDTIERLGIERIAVFGDDTLTFICTKPGIGRIRLQYFVGVIPEGLGGYLVDITEYISGTIVDKEFLIIARENNDTGGWL